jgi:hypothetical protein
VLQDVATVAVLMASAVSALLAIVLGRTLLRPVGAPRSTPRELIPA